MYLALPALDPVFLVLSVPFLKPLAARSAFFLLSVCVLSCALPIFLLLPSVLPFVSDLCLMGQKRKAM